MSADDFSSVLDFAGEDAIVFYERAVLGSLLLEPRYLADIDLDGREFISEQNRLIFCAMREMDSKNTPIDVITVSQHLDSCGLAAQTGGLIYLGSLTGVPPTPKNVVFYAKNLAGRAVAQVRATDLVRISGRLADVSKSAAQKPGFDLDSHLGEIESEIGRVKNLGVVHKTLSCTRELSSPFMDDISSRFENQGVLSGLSTGFLDLDEKLYGLQRGDLIVIAGRPSMGKTAFAVNIAENIAISTSKPVGLIVSLEMPALHLMARMISSTGRIRSENLRSGRLTEQDFDRLTMAAHAVNGMNLYIDDRSTACLADIRSALRRVIITEGRIDFLVIDYLQLMNEPVKTRSEGRVEEISAISRGLKAIAKEYNIPVVVLSQLNRSLEKRNDKRPMMSDLRESGAIEQDADVILFVYRDEVYNPDTAEPGLAEIIIGKQRNGPIGVVPVNFEKEYSKFSGRQHSGGY